MYWIPRARLLGDHFIQLPMFTIRTTERFPWHLRAHFWVRLQKRPHVQRARSRLGVREVVTMGTLAEPRALSKEATEITETTRRARKRPAGHSSSYIVFLSRPRMTRKGA